jgi:hypothetical protein
MPPLNAEQGEQLVPSARPANDDRHSVGPILRALNKRPSRLPQILAIGFSALWLLLASIYIYASRGSLAGQGSVFTRPETALYGLLAFGPVLFFIITAILIRRAQEMRLTARSLAEIAMRLAEPETIATEQMVTLSQAIRREIVSMGDGIERALARAGELETLVRSEVSNLERSYSDNERRIKALVDGLSSERENMLNNAERMRTAITSVQEAFAQDIQVASAHLADGLGEAANRVTTSLGAKGEEIRFALGRTGEELVSNLLLRGEDIIGRLEQTQQSIGYTLAETGDAVTRSLAQRLEEIDVHLRSTSEAASASVAETLGDAVTAIAVHGDRVNEALAERIAQFEAAVLGPGNQVAERVAAETGQMAALLTNHYEAIETTLGQCGTELDLRSQQAAEALEAQLRAFEERTGVKTQQVEASLEGLLTRLDSGLGQYGNELELRSLRVAEALELQLHTFEERATLKTQEVEASLDGILARLDSGLGQCGNELEYRSLQATEALETQLRTFEERATAKTQEVEGSLDGILARIDSGLGQCGSELEQRSLQAAEALESQLRAFEERAAVKAEEVESSLNGILSRLDMGLDQYGGELELRSLQAAEAVEAQLRAFEERATAKTYEVEQSLDGILTRLDSGLGQCGHELELRSQQTAEALEAQLRAFEERASDKAQEVERSLDGLLVRIDSGLDGRAAAINESLATHTLKMAKVLGDGGREVTQALDSRIGEVEAIFVNRSTSLTDTLSAKAEELNLVLGGRALEIAETFSARAGEVSEVLGGRASDITEALSRRTAEANEVLGARALEINDAFSARTDEISQILGSRASEINEVFSARADEVNQVLGTRALEIAETLDARIARFEEQVVGRLETISGELDSRGHNVAETLIACATEIDSTLREHAATIGQVLDHESGQLTAVLSGRVDALRELLSQASADLDTTLAGRTEEIGSVLTERVNEIGGALAHRLVDVQTALDERSEALRSTLNGCLVDVRSLVDEKGSGLVELLSARGSEITEQMTSVGELVTQILESRGASIVEELGLKQRELTGALDESSANLRTAVEAGAVASVSALVEANEKLTTEIGSTLGQLDERNLALQSIIDNAGTTLGAVQTALAGEIGGFREAIGGITEEIQTLGSNAETTIASASALYENITRQQEALAAAASELVRSQAELDHSLDQRRASLDSLLASVDERRDDFNAVMHSFSDSIDEAFERVEARARDIGAFLAEASQATTGLVERQFGEIRTAMGNERAHTATVLRAAYDQANSEIETIFGQSTQRFQAAAAEMRGLAREIQRELETTREELRRNAVNLPQETAEQAAAMRRVVADQIKALNELTDVVARSGRAYDVSEPLTPAAARIVEAGAPVRRIEPSRVEQARFVEPTRVEASRPAAVVPPARSSAPAPAAERSGAGWLTDLLARASRDDVLPPRPGALSRGGKQTEGLETISHDIARMVDHAAVADAWEHYRRGDVNAFTRQLYIGRGPQTFDDIRRRYQSDPDFRTTVDRYIEEFERLLADVNRDDRDDSLTRTYLTSETGKVYTMLAHAAGRLV